VNLSQPSHGTLHVALTVFREILSHKAIKATEEGERQMKEWHPEQGSQRYQFAELALTRSRLLEHLYEGQVVPTDLMQSARNYAAVTHWEELKCAVFNPKARRLMAVVGIHRPDGYSGFLRRHGSKEYVRFFVDWGRGEGYQALNLNHFKVCDAPLGSDPRGYPTYKLISTRFDEDRYWESVLDGIQPQVRAVLSWQQVPPTTASFMPVFGNVIESRIRVESISELMGLFEIEEARREPVLQAQEMRLA
jgi:hypothetical protein